VGKTLLKSLKRQLAGMLLQIRTILESTKRRVSRDKVIKIVSKKGMLLSRVPRREQEKCKLFYIRTKNNKSFFYNLYINVISPIKCRNYCSSSISECKNSLSGKFTSITSLTTTGKTQKSFETLISSKK